MPTWPLFFNVSQELQAQYVNKSELDPNLLPLQGFRSKQVAQPANRVVLSEFSSLLGGHSSLSQQIPSLKLFSNPSPLSLYLTIMTSLVQAIRTNAITF